MKILKFIVLLLVIFVAAVAVIASELEVLPVGGNFAGIILGGCFPVLKSLWQDISDTTDWKVSQRKLMRGDFLKKDTLVRISFAYLYRIKAGDKYFLVRNARGTGKYQPVGGVYKLQGNEKTELKNLYHVVDDDKIPIDNSSQDDYRLRLECRYLRGFLKRFDTNAKREQIDNLGREFKEEVVDTGFVNWDQITYRVCGRYITRLEYGKHFQMYELLLADIVELIPTEDQKKDLELLSQRTSEKYIFATAEDIKALGVDTMSGKLSETIADHSFKIIQEFEGNLIHISKSGEIYTVML